MTRGAGGACTPDHRAAGFLACDAVVAARDPHFFPEHGLAHHRPDAMLLFECEEPDHAEDVTGHEAAKVAALLAHVSQFETTMRIACRATTPQAVPRSTPRMHGTSWPPPAGSVGVAVRRGLPSHERPVTGAPRRRTTPKRVVGGRRAPPNWPGHQVAGSLCRSVLVRLVRPWRSRNQTPPGRPAEVAKEFRPRVSLPIGSARSATSRPPRASDLVMGGPVEVRTAWLVLRPLLSLGDDAVLRDGSPPTPHHVGESSAASTTLTATAPVLAELDGLTIDQQLEQSRSSSTARRCTAWRCRWSATPWPPRTSPRRRSSRHGKRFPTYRGEAPLRSWVLRITHNTADLVACAAAVEDDVVDPASSCPSTSHARHDRSTQAERHASMAAFEAALWCALDELSRSVDRPARARIACRTRTSRRVLGVAAAHGQDPPVARPPASCRSSPRRSGGREPGSTRRAAKLSAWLPRHATLDDKVDHHLRTTATRCAGAHRGNLAQPATRIYVVALADRISQRTARSRATLAQRACARASTSGKIFSLLAADARPVRCADEQSAVRRGARMNKWVAAAIAIGAALVVGQHRRGRRPATSRCRDPRQSRGPAQQRRRDRQPRVLDRSSSPAWSRRSGSSTRTSLDKLPEQLVDYMPTCDVRRDRDDRRQRRVEPSPATRDRTQHGIRVAVDASARVPNVGRSR